MTQARFLVSQAGPLVSIQDAGRTGLMRFGVPASGAMDRFALAAANAALGNPADAPVIEISMGGLALDCLSGTVAFAVVGGGFRVMIDDTAHGSWTVQSIGAGSRLVIRPGTWGSWTYLAFAGRLQARRWLASASTHASSGLGGGRLAGGQELLIDDAVMHGRRPGPIACPPFARPGSAIRVVPGPQDRFFATQTLETFYREPFTLTDSYDRMGVRLAGPPLRPEAALDMPSEPILRGSIQVAGDGVATVLLADHQTTGGYPKIATVASYQLDSFAQLRSRARVVFRPVTPHAALEATRTRRSAQRRFLAALAARDGRPP